MGKWGVKRGEETHKTSDGRELCEGEDWDNEVIGEYHPGLSEGERLG